MIEQGTVKKSMKDGIQQKKIKGIKILVVLGCHCWKCVIMMVVQNLQLCELLQSKTLLQVPGPS